VDALQRAHVPAGTIRTVLEALAAAAAAGDPATTAVEHPAAGRLELVRPAVRLASAPEEAPMPPPLLGQHTREVLRETALPECDVDALAAAPNIGS
jgi:crotonobetainyl-CoA:carnitine CoA-transferase CaiB-like acyl-CoA transferase